MSDEFLLYRAPNGAVSIDVLVQDESVWLTQKALAELFGVTRPSITRHLQNIFGTGELVEASVCSVFEHTAADGKSYSTRYYNLDAIIAVGYRVNSFQATQFRIWATRVLREYLIKGFALDDERLKQRSREVWFSKRGLRHVSGRGVENHLAGKGVLPDARSNEYGRVLRPIVRRTLLNSEAVFNPSRVSVLPDSSQRSGTSSTGHYRLNRRRTQLQQRRRDEVRAGTYHLVAEPYKGGLSQADPDTSQRDTHGLSASMKTAKSSLTQ